jgi:hypothetical protein
MKFTKQDAKVMWRNGETPTDILRAATAAGVEYPDAVWLVKDALKLNEEAFNEMEDGYMDQI